MFEKKGTGKNALFPKIKLKLLFAFLRKNLTHFP